MLHPNTAVRRPRETFRQLAGTTGHYWTKQDEADSVAATEPFTGSGRHPWRGRSRDRSRGAIGAEQEASTPWPSCASGSARASIGTMKNRMAHLRWWAERIGRPGVLRSNGALGIANCEYVTNEDKSVVIAPDKLALVKDEHVALALRLEADFGLRREEAIKFAPSRDDRGDRIRLKGSTTKHAARTARIATYMHRQRSS